MKFIMRKVIKNGTVITMSPKSNKYEKVDIVIDDDKITDITSEYTGEYDALIDATNKIVMPGLINAHTHLGMSYFRATNDNLTLQKWLNEKIWPIEDKMTDEDTYYSSALGILEMIKTGTTCSNDMYFNCEGTLKALKQLKTRCLFTRCLLGTNNNDNGKIEEFIQLFNKYKNEELIKFCVAPHALYTCDLNYLKKCSSLAEELNLPVHVHYCENRNEINDIRKIYNLSPLEVLKQSNLINNKLILAHATFIDDESLEEFKNREISFVHNPVSNLNLGCGFADITKYSRYVNIALGTDGVGSGNNLNMFYHMSLVDLLQKGRYEDPTVFSSYDVLKMATINGAKALGMDDEIGSIEIGKKADIIMLDLNDLTTKPCPDIITNICHNAFNCVSMTMVNGEVLMQDKKILIDIDENDLIKKAERRIMEISNLYPEGNNKE